MRHRRNHCRVFGEKMVSLDVWVYCTTGIQLWKQPGDRDVGPFVYNSAPLPAAIGYKLLLEYKLRDSSEVKLIPVMIVSSQERGTGVRGKVLSVSLRTAHPLNFVQ